MRFSSAVVRGVLWLTWQAIRLPLFSILLIFEPIVRWMLSWLALWTFLIALVWEFAGADPRFPFWGDRVLRQLRPHTDGIPCIAALPLKVNRVAGLICECSIYKTCRQCFLMKHSGVLYKKHRYSVPYEEHCRPQYSCLGVAVKTRRLELEWSQEVLAKHLGVQRQWVIRFEAGSDGAEIGTVLKALTALGLSIVVGSEPAGRSERSAPTSNLDDVFARLATPALLAKPNVSVRPRSKKSHARAR